MHHRNWDEEEEDKYVKRDLQDYNINVVREGEKFNPIKGQEEEQKVEQREYEPRYEFELELDKGGRG